MFITSETVFTVVDPMDDEQGLRDNLCDLSQARIAPVTISNYSILVQCRSSLNKEDCNLEDQGSTLSNVKRDSKTACCSQS